MSCFWIVVLVNRMHIKSLLRWLPEFLFADLHGHAPCQKWVAIGGRNCGERRIGLRFCTFITLLMTILQGTSILHAGMIIDPLMHNDLINPLSPPSTEDFFIQIPLSGTFQGHFFGQVINTPIYASENGSIVFGPNTDFWPDANNSVARLSPFWEDFIYVPGQPNRITAFHSPGEYLAVSWLRANLFWDEIANGVFPPTDRSFQALWFESDVSIGGFGFKRDDIAFSYVGNVAGTSDFGHLFFAQVSLDEGGGNTGRRSVLPGSITGDVTHLNTNLLPWEEDRFLLFRWNSATLNYDATIESLTAIPEPSSLVLVLGAVTLGGLRLRMRQRRARATQPADGSGNVTVSS